MTIDCPFPQDKKFNDFEKEVFYRVVFSAVMLEKDLSVKL